MAIGRQLYARVFAVSCLAGAALSIAKTIRVFFLNPRELGSPHGAAEDWLLLAMVLLTASLSAWITQDIVAIGKNAIVIFSLGFAVISFQAAAEIYTGLVPRYFQDGQSVVERNEFENVAMAAVFLGTGLGIYRRRAWGHTLCLIVSVILGLGCVGYLVIEGLSWKPLVAFAVVASVIVWLRLPVVRYRLKEGSAQ
jgi:hypothetical protein